jgi:hypothetical protein
VQKNKFSSLKVKTSKDINEEAAGDKVYEGLKSNAYPLTINEDCSVDAERDAIIVIRPDQYKVPQITKNNTKKAGLITESGDQEDKTSTVYENNRIAAKVFEYGDERKPGINYNDDNKMNKNEYAWVRRGNSFFISAKPNTESIPAGLYDIRSSMETGLFIERRSVILDDLFLPPSDVMGKIMADIEKFWGSQDKYAEYGIIYKRGILTFGVPGGGKTSLINILVSKLISEHQGIILNMTEISSFIAMVQNIRALEPTRPILALIEDLDGFLQYNSVQQFLNLLDGNNACDNIVYLGSTNYINRLEPRVIRSSRFDRKYEIPTPDAKVREFYLRKKLKPADLEKLGEMGLKTWVSDTEGMVFGDLKELIASVVVMEMPYSEVIAELKKYMNDEYFKHKYNS